MPTCMPMLMLSRSSNWVLLVGKGVRGGKVLQHGDVLGLPSEAHKCCLKLVISVIFEGVCHCSMAIDEREDPVEQFPVLM